MLEEIDDVGDFLMAPNNDSLVVHIFNTIYGQHYVACFNLNLAMKWFVEITKVYQPSRLYGFIGIVQG